MTKELCVKQHGSGSGLSAEIPYVITEGFSGVGMIPPYINICGDEII